MVFVMRGKCSPYDETIMIRERISCYKTITRVIGRKEKLEK
ncbi:MAG: hypothetical protein UX58_C0008G0018 [Candidatus Wolfebacteria bacterium GW2011_GWB2_46_69]|nr:MAG: hypothetical protein UX58_C0008G0018 [Candidatus Wolfebacteria bacterium GW2011_GWB2_46_69]